MSEVLKAKAFSLIHDLALEAKSAKRLRDMKAYLDDIQAVARYQQDVLPSARKRAKKFPS